MVAGVGPRLRVAPREDASLFLTAGEGSFQASQVFKDTQAPEREGWLTALGECGTDQLRVSNQHRLAGIIRRQGVDGAARSVKGRANGLFYGLFESLVGFCDGSSGIAQAMDLASLMMHAGKDVGYGQK